VVEFFDSKIVPDKKIGEHRLAGIGQVQQVLICPVPCLLPSGSVFKVTIISIVYILHRSKHTTAGDALFKKQRPDIIDGQPGVLNTAVDMAVDNLRRAHANLLGG
jgi:hypothetical protein